MANDNPNGDGGNYDSGNDTGLSNDNSYDGNSYGGDLETSAGGVTPYGESSAPGVADSRTETPVDTPGGIDADPQTESTGYSYSLTPEGEFVLHSPPGSELNGWTPDGRHIMRQSDGSLCELHFGDEYGA